MNFVTEDDICNWVFNNNGVLYTRKYNNIFKTDLGNLPDLTFVCLTGYPNIIEGFFRSIINKFSKRFILITLETDVCLFKEEYINNNLLYHWFSWNKTINHNKLTCIPIGLNKDRHVNSMNTFIRKNKNNEKSELFAVNLSISSNKDRIKMIEMAKNKWNNFCKHIENIPFKETYVIGSHIEGKIRINVTDTKCYDILSNFKFILSPPGAGIDCHRTWEALYVGTIPIIISSCLDEIYNDLPVLIVEKWDDITEDFLNKKYIEINDKKNRNEYKMEKLEMSYWLNLINDKRKEKNELEIERGIKEYKIHFMTYGNEKFINSRERILNEANNFGVFSSIIGYKPDDIPIYFKNKYSDILSLSRGGGYWIWRPVLILDMLNKTNEDDIIVYLDAGCTINKYGIKRFYEYIDMLNNNKDNYGILSFQMSGNPNLSGKLEPENRWTCKEIFDYYKISPNSNIGKSGQYLGGILVIKNNKHSKEIFKNVLNALEYDKYMFTDKYNINQHEEFKENRHEQSIFSIERKKNGSVVLDGDESWIIPFGGDKSLKYPFWATRIRH